MAKQQPQTRRPNQPQAAQPQQVRKPAPAPVRPREQRESLFSTGSNELIFGRQNFQWMGIGLGLVILGLVLMMGGKQPSPDVWDESQIYSFRRITLAPLCMVAGFLVVIYGIFKNDTTSADAAETSADA